MEPQQEQEFEPRPYQISLYEKAFNENSILYLPTGTGKTFIAVLLVKRMSGSLQLPYSGKGKRTVFIVNTVALVHQQSTFLSRHTGLQCRGYSGDMQVDFWTEEQWMNEIVNTQVLVMTAQIFLNLILHGVMPLNKVNLLIFDECHRAVSNHPMRQIMQRFEDCPQTQQPRVLAMSASLLNSNVKIEKIQATLKELEITFHSKIITVESLELVSKHATNPGEYVEYYSPPKEYGNLEEIKKIMNNAIEVLNSINIPNLNENHASSAIFKPVTKNVKLQRILNDVVEHINDMGLYGGSKGVLLHLIQLECIKKFADEQQLKAVLDFVTTQLIKIQKLLSQEMNETESYETIIKYSSPKVLKLIQVLKTFHENLDSNQKFCCIIFVQRRFTAKVLYHILKKLSSSDKNMEFLKPEFMVGYNNDPYKNAREQLCLTKWNKKVLMKFRNGSSNCIVATDVVDEGVDIPSCTLVIRYYEPPDFRAYIQSKGRARHRTSRFIMLASDQGEYIKKYNVFQQTEHTLHSVLRGKSEHRSKPTQDEVDTNLYVYKIPPYIITQKNGEESYLTEQIVVPLINEYCTSLIKSKFIMLTPTWVKEDVKDGVTLKFRVLLTLPPVCPLRQTVIGDTMESIDDAKRSAAMKACIALHKIGELDDNLLPRKVEDAVKNTEHLFPFMEKEQQTPDTAIPGTASKKRRHPLEHPKSLYAGFPEENKRLYLHIMQMKPNYSKPDDNRHKVFHDLLESGKTFGILSTNTFPEIPAFPIFMNVGDLLVHVKTNCKVDSLKSTEILTLKVFHTLIFTDVVKVMKDFCIFDAERENSFLVVPVTKDQLIDWETVNQYQCIDYVKPKKPIEVKNSDYELSLIHPDYRAGHVYIVTEVCEYLRANSSFPTPDYESYVHYFKNKHDRKIENQAQPMLEVKPISKKINCIKPRNIKAGVSKRKRANLTEDFEEHLVPELCERINFPAVYWLKATTLPSILQRITQLLVAEDLRTQIIKETHLSLEPLSLNQKWEPLKIEEEIISSPVISMNTTLEEEQEYEEIDVDDLAGQDATVLEIDILSEEKNLYSWKVDEEPSDLERCADKIQLIDIEAYYQFMAGVTSADKKNLKFQNTVKSVYVSATKVTVPPLKILVETNPRGPSPVDILLSLTAKMAADSFNFERVETLGDSFLKYAISLFLLQEYPTFGEGPLTFLKGKLVGNLNLFYCGKQKNIMGRMNILEFSPLTNFITPAYTVDQRINKLLPELNLSPNILYEFHIPQDERFAGQMSDRTLNNVQEKLFSWPEEQNVTLTGIEHFVGTQLVPDKSVSDCVEALIGTYLSHLGIEGALNILKWFEILPKNLNINEYLYSQVPSAQLGIGNINDLTPWAEKIEERIGYRFRDRAFLLQAFTHPSFTLNQLTGSYQRLEFLGDAVLDFLLTVHIYESCGNLSPGELTDLRSALVNNITFACLSVRYGLHTALSAYAPKLFDIIDRFVKFQEERNHEVNDELLWVLMEEEECNMAEHVDVPKVLGDIYESVIGAIFLDSGKNLQTVWEIIYCLMRKEIDLFSKNVPKQPIRVIHETQGANPKFSKAEIVEGTQTVMVTLSISVSGDRKFFHGFGATKKLAKCAASKQALKYLRYKRQ